MKYMGIDVGTKRIGVALSDDAGVLAFPHSVIPVNEHTVQALQQLVTSESIEKVVVGESRNRDNTHNAVHSAAVALGASLENYGVPVAFAWEGYSSAHARTLGAYTEGAPRGDIARKRTTKSFKKHVDDAAAALILQSYIDNLS